MNRTIAAILLTSLAAVGAAGCYSDGTKNNLLAAVNSGDLVQIRSIIEKKPDVIDAYLNDGWTALTFAAKDGNVSVVNFLIEKGADINKLEGGGNSPLYWAAKYGHEDIVALLLRHGANIHHKCAKCLEPIDVARENNYEGIVNMLVEQVSSQAGLPM
ncbi:ankyrin repeat domain-containing protein [Stenotrophomonas sp. LGBM10]|uniref:ankyrin repeat domain-containing protein n=1 Tax=Stenotrophomonas sp. LGBM10 TaxID=3390038 RepID=UPI00398ABD82